MSEPGFKKLPPLPGKNNPCANCPPIKQLLEMDRTIAVGLGYAGVECNGRTVWHETGHDEFENCWTVRQAEAAAKKQPGADWRIVLNGPLHGETYQRQGEGLWVLVEKNEGFA